MSESNVSGRDIKKMLVDGRDARQALIAEAAAKHTTVCVLKANTPGYPKNTRDSDFLLRVFTPLLEAAFTLDDHRRHAHLSGDFILFVTAEEARTVKRRASRIEETHPLGRFIDIDVYENGRVLSRVALGQPIRRCYLCSEPAQQCARLKTHRYDRLRKAIEIAIARYIGETLADAAADAMRRELFLHPKLGLVTHRDKGAHEDMDHRDLLRSIATLKPFFRTFAEAGLTPNLDVSALRKEGIKAERAMLEASGGVNTHKGMVFILGCILSFLARALYQGQALEEAVAAMRSTVKPLVNADFSAVASKSELSAGERMYKDYGIRGVRGEVEDGFPSVFAWYPAHTWRDEQKLCAIIARLDDTTVVNRHNLGTLKALKNEMKALIEETPFNIERYRRLSDTYKKAGVSPGGSADMLALAFLFERLDPLLGQTSGS